MVLPVKNCLAVELLKVGLVQRCYIKLGSNGGSKEGVPDGETFVTIHRLIQADEVANKQKHKESR
jgi:hypothetical protein